MAKKPVKSRERDYSSDISTYVGTPKLKAVERAAKVIRRKIVFLSRTLAGSPAPKIRGQV